MIGRRRLCWLQSLSAASQLTPSAKRLRPHHLSDMVAHTTHHRLLSRPFPACSSIHLSCRSFIPSFIFFQSFSSFALSFFPVLSLFLLTCASFPQLIRPFIRPSVHPSLGPSVRSWARPSVLTLVRSIVLRPICLSVHSSL